MHLSFSFRAAFRARENLWGRTVCFKVYVFDKLRIKSVSQRTTATSPTSFDMNWFGLRAWKTEDAAHGNRQRETKGGSVPQTEVLMGGVLQYKPVFNYC